jgi:hypothetical protein
VGIPTGFSLQRKASCFTHFSQKNRLRYHGREKSHCVACRSYGFGGNGLPNGELVENIRSIARDHLERLDQGLKLTETAEIRKVQAHFRSMRKAFAKQVNDLLREKTDSK